MIFNTGLTHLDSEVSIYPISYISKNDIMVKPAIHDSYSMLYIILYILPRRETYYILLKLLFVQEVLVSYISKMIYLYIWSVTYCITFADFSGFSWYLLYFVVFNTNDNIIIDDMEASKPNWVNPMLSIIGVNLLRLRGLHMKYNALKKDWPTKHSDLTEIQFN